MLETVRGVARSHFDGSVGPAHDWHHVERVEALARRLAADRTDLDETTLFLAVYLHDIGRPAELTGEIDDHAVWGADEAGRILDEQGVDEETIEAVAHCIRAHRFSNDVEPETPDARVLSDADNLDALGAIGVARVFAYGGEGGIPIYDPALPVEADDSPAGRTGANHIRTKILDLPNRMYTTDGRRFAEERVQFVRQFVDRLEAEAVGER